MPSAASKAAGCWRLRTAFHRRSCATWNPCWRKLRSEDSANAELVELDRLLQNLTRATSLGLLTGVVLPLFMRKQIIGLIFIFRNYAGNFSGNDRALLQSFADQAAIAVRNAQLYTELSLEKRRLDALLDSAADGIFILQFDHTIEHCNPAFARMIGIPSKEILREEARPGGALELDQRGGLRSRKQKKAAGRSRPMPPCISKETWKGAPAVPLPVGITYAPLLMPDGTLTNIIATARDITRFREADELKSTFISVISHELKTPIALIKGYVSTLRREDAHWEREIVQDSLAVIEEEADRLTEMIENLLDATRLQAGAMVIDPSDVALDGLAGRIAEQFRTQSSAHRILVDFPPNFPVILADENRLEQVISNLLSNAIQVFTGGGRDPRQWTAAQGPGDRLCK